MKNIINLLRRKLFTENNKVMYGRWNLDYDKNLQDRKVYLTNMDHCGCCEHNCKNDNKNGYDNWGGIYDNWGGIYDNDYLRPYFL
jgi:hypothetical protein